ncbi:MAG: DUF2608 domain-containing protein [Alphaproteobacteria bacterium]|nr:DUF2608 domain-containing protein [Alphaproteobacteria bacterium]
MTQGPFTRAFLFLAAFFTCFTTTHASITEIHSLKEISLKNKRAGMVVLFDIDENILLNIHHTPSTFKYLAPSHQSHRMLEPDIAQTTTGIKHCINGDSGKVFMFGLTKRCLYWGPHMTPDNGHEHAEQAGIPFSRVRFKHFNGTTLCHNPHAGFNNGIIYTAGQPKNLYAEAFFNLAKINPTFMIFSDDLIGNINDMVRYAQSKNIPIEAYHMTRVHLLDTFVRGIKQRHNLPKDFDPDQYLHHNLDVFACVATKRVSEQFSFAQHHYLTWGQQEQRFVSYPKNFSPHRYVAHNSDIAAHAQTHNLDPLIFALEHYRSNGHKENRSL